MEICCSPFIVNKSGDFLSRRIRQLVCQELQGRTTSCFGTLSSLDLMRHHSRLVNYNLIRMWSTYVGDSHERGPPLLFKIYFQDGTFKLTLEFSEEYPNKPPVVKFLSKVNKIVQKNAKIPSHWCSFQMFHPNIYADGGICLDILQVS